MVMVRTPLLIGILCTCLSAQAHGVEPLRTVEVQIGPYPVEVAYYNDPRGGGTLDFSLELKEHFEGEMAFTVIAVPGPTTDATPVKATLEPAAHQGGVDGRVRLPVSGQWLLDISATGHLGPGLGNAPVLAGTPPTIPFWLGWIVGLTPVGLLFGFIFIRVARTAGYTSAPSRQSV